MHGTLGKEDRGRRLHGGCGRGSAKSAGTSKEKIIQAEIVVIGGGAAGMAAAIAAIQEKLKGARSGALFGCKGLEQIPVLILEKNDKLGKKLLATGNGRCNFTNRHCGEASIGRGDCKLEDELSPFAREPLRAFGVKDTIRFFEALGIIAREESEGRMYPYSEQAVAVVDALAEGLDALGVRVRLQETAARIEVLKGTELEEKGFRFRIHTEAENVIEAGQVILAAGGKAGPQYGCTGDGYRIARDLGHRIVPPLPALVQMSSSKPALKQLKGVRAKGRAILLRNGDSVSGESGEIQFTETGLSGICIFNLSRRLDELKRRETADTNAESGGRTRYAVEIDFFPDRSREQLEQLLLQRRSFMECRNLDQFLIGLLNGKLIPAITADWSVRTGSGAKGGTARVADISDGDIKRLAVLLKSWEIPIDGTKGWAEAQVTAGGISEEEIDPKTMESLRTPGLYFAGEVIDVDGKCGGYNLQWAWTSGVLSGRSAAQLCSGKESKKREQDASNT